MYYDAVKMNRLNRVQCCHGNDADATSRNNKDSVLWMVSVSEVKCNSLELDVLICPYRSLFSILYGLERNHRLGR